MMVPSSFQGSGSSKRPRVHTPSSSGTANQVARCLVDGCNADLSLSRDYHRRHKVCEAHSKTPVVTVSGREQRFCQQCSRFHSLEEFDDGKRSCRKRLDGHNRRRRKPPPGTQALNFSPLLFEFGDQPSPSSSTMYISFRSAAIMPPSVWPGVITAANDTALYNGFQGLNFHDPSTDDPTFFTHGHGRHHRRFNADEAFSLLSTEARATQSFSWNTHTRDINQATSSTQAEAHSFSDNVLFHQFPHDGGSSSRAALSSSQHHENATSTFHFQEMFRQNQH